MIVQNPIDAVISRNRAPMFFFHFFKFLQVQYRVVVSAPSCPEFGRLAVSSCDSYRAVLGRRLTVLLAVEYWRRQGVRR